MTAVAHRLGALFIVLVLCLAGTFTVFTGTSNAADGLWPFDITNKSSGNDAYVVEFTMRAHNAGKVLAEGLVFPGYSYGTWVAVDDDETVYIHLHAVGVDAMPVVYRPSYAGNLNGYCLETSGTASLIKVKARHCGYGDLVPILPVY